MPVRVQTEPFEIGAEIECLREGKTGIGAIAAFMGTVRDLNDVQGSSASVTAMHLEHYPGMTERALADICEEAHARFAVIDSLVVHRVGELRPADAIVLVVVTAAHRGDAFDACEFIMDYLKTKAPFWKKELTPAGARWVEGRPSDDAAAGRWRTSSEPLKS